MKTPEGIYKIDGRNPQSSFHLALHISYPSDEDDKRAAARGVPPGFDIMIHGIQNGRGWIGAFHRWNDWTAGCIAVTDEELIDATKEIGAAEGIFCAPEGAACLPALKKMQSAGAVKAGERVVLFNTGSGVKYVESFS